MKYRMFLITVLAAVGFFNPYQMFSPQLQKFMFYLCILICMVITLRRDCVPFVDLRFPRVSYFILLAGICGSTLMATGFHQQSFRTSVITTIPYLFGYLFFYILLKFDLSRPRIMNTYLGLCAFSVFIYFCNLMSAPYNIYGEPMLGEDTTRGIIRLPVVFIEFFPMIIFYAINQWFETHKKKWIYIGIIGIIMVFMSVIRQIIALTCILGLLFMFRAVSWKIKVLLGVGVVVVVVWVLPLIPIYSAMMELSEEQKEKNDETEDIRITSWRYYTYENQTNLLSPFFGNGVPAFEQSKWGIMVDNETDELGTYAVDVGWAGFFWYFGGVTTAALLVLLFKALFKRKPQQRQYLNYWLVFLLLTSIASGPILFYYQIIDVSVCLYLVYRQKDDDVPKPLTETADAEDSTDNTQLQQRGRYPQLSRFCR